MVRVEADYRVHRTRTARSGCSTCSTGRRQLVLQHSHVRPRTWDAPCAQLQRHGRATPSAGARDHLARRDTAFAAVSRAPFPLLAAVAVGPWLDVPLVLVGGQHLQLRLPRHARPGRRARVSYNFRDADELAASGVSTWMLDYVGEQPGISAFLREGDDVFHTYATYGRGVEAMMHAYDLLDLTALGRQEDWEQPAGARRSSTRRPPGFMA